MAGVWHVEQPIDLNSDEPFEIDCAPPGTFVEATGGASSRMNSANSTMSDGTCAFCAAWSGFDATLKLVASSGYPCPERFKQLAGSPSPCSSCGSGRSWENISLVMPISTLYASAAKSSRDLFWPLQRKRPIVRSLLWGLHPPPMPKLLAACAC